MFKNIISFTSSLNRISTQLCQHVLKDDIKPNSHTDFLYSTSLQPCVRECSKIHLFPCLKQEGKSPKGVRKLEGCSAGGGGDEGEGRESSCCKG